MRLCRIFFVLFLSACSTPTGTFIERDARHEFAPWSTSERHPTLERTGHSHGGSGSGMFDQAFKVYARFITKIDGARCEHRPTCSRYARDAIRKHGLFLGAFLAVDRLVRGTRSSPLRQLDLYTIENGRPYFEDPIEDNDFFF